MNEKDLLHESSDESDATLRITASDSEGRVAIPIVEERLIIDKLVEETGVVRVRKTTTEHPETVRFESIRETVEVERVPIGRFVDGPVETRQEGETTVIPVLEEVVVVETRLRLREEIRITRKRTTESVEQTVVLRKEEAVVEREAPNPKEK